MVTAMHLTWSRWW